MKKASTQGRENITHLPKRRKYSVINLLRDKNKSNKNIENIISNMSLEDLIAIKLEMTVRSVPNPLYGFNIWHRLDKIVKEAVLRYAITSTRSNYDAASFLGITRTQLSQLITAYAAESWIHDEIVTRDKRYIIREKDNITELKSYKRAAEEKEKNINEQSDS